MNTEPFYSQFPIVCTAQPATSRRWAASPLGAALSNLRYRLGFNGHSANRRGVLMSSNIPAQIEVDMNRKTLFQRLVRYSAIAVTACLAVQAHAAVVLTGAAGSTVNFNNSAGNFETSISSGTGVNLTSPLVEPGTISLDTLFDGHPTTQVSQCGPIQCESFEAGSAGTVNVTANGTTLVNAVINSFEIFANPGSNAATFQFNLSCTTNNGISLGSCLLASGDYLILSGTTTSPVGTANISSIGTYLAYSPMTLDWSARESTTAYTPTSVPLPASVWLLLSGVGLLGLVMRRKSHVPLSGLLRA
jgi:hypothetical protein